MTPLVESTPLPTSVFGLRMFGFQKSKNYIVATPLVTVVTHLIDSGITIISFQEAALGQQVWESGVKS